MRRRADVMVIRTSAYGKNGAGAGPFEAVCRVKLRTRQRHSRAVSLQGTLRLRDGPGTVVELCNEREVHAGIAPHRAVQQVTGVVRAEGHSCRALVRRKRNSPRCLNL